MRANGAERHLNAWKGTKRRLNARRPAYPPQKMLFIFKPMAANVGRITTLVVRLKAREIFSSPSA
jgi:hypothetical protein